MEVSSYIGRSVKIDLTNGFYYSGVVISTDKNSLTLRDKLGQLVTLSLDSILFIREVI